MLSSLGFLFVIVVAMTESNANLDGSIGDEQREDTTVVVPRDTWVKSLAAKMPNWKAKRGYQSQMPSLHEKPGC